MLPLLIWIMFVPFSTCKFSTISRLIRSTALSIYLAIPSRAPHNHEFLQIRIAILVETFFPGKIKHFKNLVKTLKINFILSSP